MVEIIGMCCSGLMASRISRKLNEPVSHMPDGLSVSGYRARMGECWSAVRDATGAPDAITCLPDGLLTVKGSEKCDTTCMPAYEQIAYQNKIPYISICYLISDKPCKALLAIKRNIFPAAAMTLPSESPIDPVHRDVPVHRDHRSRQHDDHLWLPPYNASLQS